MSSAEGSWLSGAASHVDFGSDSVWVLTIFRPALPKVTHSVPALLVVDQQNVVSSIASMILQLREVKTNVLRPQVFDRSVTNPQEAFLEEQAAHGVVATVVDWQLLEQ